MPDSTPDARVVNWELPHDLSMAGKARGMVRETLLSWGLQALADDVVLATGELLANALAYGAPPIGLALSARGDELRVEVTDHGRGRPRRLDLGVEAVHGRGLAIVEALAAECGVTTRSGVVGKTVWARWRVPARCAPPAQDAGRRASGATGIACEPFP
ncbi:ATP-binding protein [Sphaerisporangium rhizosphaerae]|uniref:ATP-binding protein n=1 Tax=Sphaerisporangium rhizosphaerae TaxID=2269375 RepID=A0ABW2PFH6_9ACTN